MLAAWWHCPRNTIVVPVRAVALVGIPRRIPLSPVSLLPFSCLACPSSLARHGDGGQRERYRWSWEQFSHPYVLNCLHIQQARYTDIPVSPGRTDEPIGLAAAREQSAENRAGNVQTQMQITARGESRLAKG